MDRKCPGQNQQFWKPEDIYDVACPHCKTVIEFWKDDPIRVCPECRREVRNPKIDLGCAKWCPYAKDCVGTLLDSEKDAGTK
jgi:hypothetical protein